MKNGDLAQFYQKCVWIYEKVTQGSVQYGVGNFSLGDMGCLVFSEPLKWII